MTDSWMDEPCKVRFTVSMTLSGNDLLWALDDPADFLMNKAGHYVSSYDYDVQVVDG